MEFKNLNTLKDWEETGYLYGLTDTQKNKLTEYYNCIRFAIGNEEDEINSLIWPVCRRAYSSAISTPEVLDLFNPLELYKDFKNLYPKLLALKMESILEHEDIESTYIISLSSNYINGLRKRVKKKK